MQDFFFRNLVTGNTNFETLSVISTNSNVEVVTADLDRRNTHQLITRYLTRRSPEGDNDVIYEWKSLQD